MSTKLTDFDIRDIIDRYSNGASISEVAKSVGRAPMTVYKVVKRSGVVRSRLAGVARKAFNRRSDIRTDVVNLFEDGMSVQAIANKLGFTDRTVIYSCLADAGMVGRSRSEAMFQRMANASPEERKSLVAAANRAAKGREVSAADLADRAFTKSQTLSKVGRLEAEFAAMLHRRKIKCVPQFPIDAYNIDIMAWPVAVEIHVNCSNPMKIAYVRNRVKNLTNLGVHIAYVWIGFNLTLTQDAADDIVAFREQVKRLPPGTGQYRVIRGSGQFVAEGCGNLD